MRRYILQMSFLDQKKSKESIPEWVQRNQNRRIIEAAGNATLLIDENNVLFAKLKTEDKIFQIDDFAGNPLNANYKGAKAVGVDRKNSKGAIALYDSNEQGVWIFELNENWTQSKKQEFISKEDKSFYSYEELLAQQISKESANSGMPARGNTTFQVGNSSWANNEPMNFQVWAINNYGQYGYKPDIDIDAVEVYSKYSSPTSAVQPNGIDKLKVAVLDTGINYDHVDLSSQWVRNLGDEPDGIDNDGNGYVDDTFGWDFVYNTNTAWDRQGHGTHVSGTIGAAANGTGISGINPEASILPIKVLGDDGRGTRTSTISGINYAVSKGVSVINMSLGSSAYSQAAYDAIARANDAGIIVVAAAGNSAKNNDEYPHYPASYNLPNIVSVASLEPDGFPSDSEDWGEGGGSHWGKESVDLLAPGGKIWSTGHDYNHQYKISSGTSMAAPAVSGAITYFWAANPHLSHHQVINQLFTSVDDRGWGEYFKTGGTLNLERLFNSTVENSSEGNTSVPEEIISTYEDNSNLIPIELKYAPIINKDNIDTLTGLSVDGDLILNYNLDQYDIPAIKPRIQEFLKAKNFDIVEKFETLDALSELSFGILDLRDDATSGQIRGLIGTLLETSLIKNIELDTVMAIPDLI